MTFWKKEGKVPQFLPVMLPCPSSEVKQGRKDPRASLDLTESSLFFFHLLVLIKIIGCDTCSSSHGSWWVRFVLLFFRGRTICLDDAQLLTERAWKYYSCQRRVAERPRSHDCQRDTTWSSTWGHPMRWNSMIVVVVVGTLELQHSISTLSIVNRCSLTWQI